MTDDAMTVSEERLRVGTERTRAGRVKLRMYVTTENVTQTVPVIREKVRLQRGWTRLCSTTRYVGDLESSRRA